MIEKLKLNNFMKHEDAEFTFSGGLQVVRGPNEACKSGLLLAVSYALFGSKALRTTFADTVTWGRPESSLRVELTITLAGRRLTFSRGKPGAEVLEDGRVIVTGQNEVSAYAANLLGCDGTAAANLIIASQNAMRGSLEQGPKATAALIEQLADFDLFDTLIERIQTNLLVGSSTSLEARLKSAQEALDLSPAAPPPDAVGHAEDMKRQEQTLAEVSSRISDILEPQLRAAELAHASIAKDVAAHYDADTAVKQAESDLNDHVLQRTECLAQARTLTVDPTELATARESLLAAGKLQSTLAAYKLFQSLPTCSHEYEGDYAAFTAWHEGRRQALQDAKAQTASLAAEIRVLEATIVSASTCGFCGQDVSAFPDVAATNDRIRAKIAEHTQSANAIAERIPEIEQEIAAGASIDKVARKVREALPALATYAEADERTTPATVKWTAEIPCAVDVAALRSRLAEMEHADERRRQLETKAETLAEVIEKDHDRLAKAQARLEAHPYPDGIDTIEGARDAARDALHKATSERGAIQTRLHDMQRNFDAHVAEFAAREAEEARLKAAVDTARKDLDDLAFNNALLKKVRAARPIIADKLWNTVLAAVSTMFSQMRGEASVVSKDSGGFKVNGQAIESLSGSTLDILGLAIRTALVKTFIPHASFMLLDEAAAACDEDRTGSLLGFVAGAGFEQVVLVTHESASASIANNLIEL